MPPETDMCRTCGEQPQFNLPRQPYCAKCLITGKKARVTENNRAMRARKAKADATAGLNKAGGLEPSRLLLGILAILQ